MASIELFCKILGINPHTFSKKENSLLEAELFIRIYNGIIEEQKKLNKVFTIQSTKPNIEVIMLDGYFIRELISEILLSGEYTLEGIALYSNTCEDVIHDILCNYNPAPSLPLSRKIIEIHRSIFPSLYSGILKRAIEKINTIENHTTCI